MGPAEIDLLWEASTSIDETAKIEIYKLMADLSTSMPDQLINAFIVKLI